MANTNVTIRMDENLKKQADDVFGELGMSFTTAVNVFTKQVIRDRAIPFQITAREGVDGEVLKTATAFAERYGDDFERMAE